MPPLPELRCIVTTFEKEEQAAEVIRTLVRERLIACGTFIHGARSIYIWQEEMHDSEEIVAILKTTRPDEAASRLAELHPYEVPEILVMTPESVNEAYLGWARDSANA